MRLARIAALIPNFRFKIKYIKVIPKGFFAQISEIDLVYMQGTVEVSKKRVGKDFKDKKYLDIQEDLCHEVAHTFTDPYDDMMRELMSKNLSKAKRREKEEKLRRLNEHQTELIGMIISKLVSILDERERKTKRPIEKL